MWIGLISLHLSSGARLSSRPSRVKAPSDQGLLDKPMSMGELSQMPQLQLLRGSALYLLALLRKQGPSLWTLLLLRGLMQQKTTQSRHDKKTAAATIRSQVVLGDDFHIAIVTTAALPWMTGTAVNPLLRSAYLHKARKRVTLMVPWLHPVDQAMIFPKGLRFETPDEQLAHMHNWLQTRGGLSSDFPIVFYPSRYDSDRGSILPLGDITRYFSPEESDIAVLEEPEHLTWYHNGANWRHRFKLIVGVVHTNYIFYAETYMSEKSGGEVGGKVLGNVMKHVNQFMCQAYCDKVIKLSDAIQPLPRSVTCNVHGVRSEFLDIGRRASFPFGQRPRGGAYFIGKALWAKGHRLLIDYLKLQRELGGAPTHIDVYGKGEDLPAIEAEVSAAELQMTFHGPVDHASRRLRDHKVFVNPSRSEVLSTTTAEALAMGKFVVIQNHPSNLFFVPFRNALFFDTPEEFITQLNHALSSTPAPLSPYERRQLSWEGATERFLSALTDSTLGDTLPTIADQSARWVHQGMAAGHVGDAIRKISGAGPVSKQAWLGEPKYRGLGVKEIVEASLIHNPPVTA